VCFFVGIGDKGGPRVAQAVSVILRGGLNNSPYLPKYEAVVLDMIYTLITDTEIIPVGPSPLVLVRPRAQAYALMGRVLAQLWLLIFMVRVAQFPYERVLWV
jgi:hypothetical protein